MEAGWAAQEEKLIAEAMASGLRRVQAIRRLRSSWRIGETPPPLWPSSRPMPEGNPRHGIASDLRPETVVPRATVISTDLCAGCGKLFKPSRTDKKTCSDRCRKLASRRARTGASKTPGEPAA